jgi:glycosyltransferase involved in cell wall biosynthesis
MGTATNAARAHVAETQPSNTASVKRALFVLITNYPGGSERVTFRLAAELAKRPEWRVEVKIVSAELPNSFSKLAPPSVRVSFGPLRSWYWSFLLLPLRLIFRRYDLVFTTQVYTNGLVSLLRRLRLVRTGRLVMRESMSVFDRFEGPKALRFALLYRGYGGEDLVIAQTAYMADHVRAWLPPRSAAHLVVVPNPVDLPAIESAAAEPLEPWLAERLRGRCNVLYCGRFVEFKRPATALEAFRIATAGMADAQMVFMGSGVLETKIRALAAAGGMSDRVLFLGNRANPYPVMAACQYGLVTSANEGFPNVAVEMMACGMNKVVITPCAGDLDRLTGVAVTRTFDVHDIAGELRAAIEKREDCSGMYRKFAGTRSVEAYLEALLRLP